MSKQRLVWLSFAGDEGFRGVAVVPITDDEIDAATDLATTIRVAEGMPESHEPMVIGAAVRKAHKLGCNPGGQVMGADVNPDLFPVDCIGRLIQRDELIERGLGSNGFVRMVRAESHINAYATALNICMCNQPHVAMDKIQQLLDRARTELRDAVAKKREREDGTPILDKQ